MTALPTSAMLKQFSSAAGQHLFIVGGSRIYDIGDDTAKLLERALRLDGVERIPIEIAALLDRNNAHPPMAPAKPPKITALSLNIAQSCNMGCGYCYAEQGTFGGAKKVMSVETARASVDRLLKWAPAESRVIIAFMGGEPLLNRSLLHDTVRYATQAARQSGHRCAFSLTTNATLITISPSVSRSASMDRPTCRIASDRCWVDRPHPNAPNADWNVCSHIGPASSTRA
jgi:uncharacterized protein